MLGIFLGSDDGVGVGIPGYAGWFGIWIGWVGTAQGMYGKKLNSNMMHEYGILVEVSGCAGVDVMLGRVLVPFAPQGTRSLQPQAALVPGNERP
jgi:hypothetical protein